MPPDGPASAWHLRVVEVGGWLGLVLIVAGLVMLCLFALRSALMDPGIDGRISLGIVVAGGLLLGPAVPAVLTVAGSGGSATLPRIAVNAFLLITGSLFLCTFGSGMFLGLRNVRVSAPHVWASGLALGVGFMAGIPFAVILLTTFFRSVLP